MRTTTMLLGLLAAGVITACTPVVSGGPTQRSPGDPTRPPRLPPRPGSTPSARASDQMRYVCRGNTPTGWIAIDYVSDTEVCSTGATNNYRYNTAVIVPLANVSVGGSLEVCAAERIPANFSNVRLISDSKRCPQEIPVADPPLATVREIMRDR